VRLRSSYTVLMACSSNARRFLEIKTSLCDGLGCSLISCTQRRTTSTVKFTHNTITQTSKLTSSGQKFIPSPINAFFYLILMPPLLTSLQMKAKLILRNMRAPSPSAHEADGHARA
jgi:hypothetical protein